MCFSPVNPNWWPERSRDPASWPLVLIGPAAGWAWPAANRYFLGLARKKKKDLLIRMIIFVFLGGLCLGCQEKKKAAH